MNPFDPNPPIISFENVSVRYRVPREHMSGIKEYAIRLLQQRVIYDDFWALHGVSFDIYPGEAFGVIGRNGAGKSTLLKVMARVLKPTEGRVILRGQVAPLLELGAGFHPELTGRENIYLNSALLGRTRSEVDALFESIIDFAEIGDFIEAPIRTYSTGMVARLGFAVATSVRPPILLVDEVLSVGDAPFQKKCLDRMLSFQEQGTTVVIVSHSLATIETFCNRALWLSHGCVELLGPVNKVTTGYLRVDKPESRPAEVSAPETSGSEFKVALHAARQLRQFRRLPNHGNIYPVEGLFEPQAGSVSVWLQLPAVPQLPDTAIFHTDDSRYVLFLGSYYDERLARYIRVVVARAGGNRRVIDTFYGQSCFPEVAASLEKVSDDDLKSDWHCLVMSWEGHPDGILRLYLDGGLQSEFAYDQEYNDDRPFPESLAIGMRPSIWSGELVENDDGTRHDLRPPSTMSLEASDVQIKDLRIYQHALLPAEVLDLFHHGPEEIQVT